MHGSGAIHATHNFCQTAQNSQLRKIQFNILCIASQWICWKENLSFKDKLLYLGEYMHMYACSYYQCMYWSWVISYFGLSTLSIDRTGRTPPPSSAESSKMLFLPFHDFALLRQAKKHYNMYTSLLSSHSPKSSHPRPNPNPKPKVV